MIYVRETSTYSGNDRHKLGCQKGLSSQKASLTYSLFWVPQNNQYLDLYIWVKKLSLKCAGFRIISLLNPRFSNA